MTSALWRRWYGETTGWAIRANERLLAELSPDVAEAVRARRETQVALYGPTQSGKTTLVLRLLGIARDAFAEVERVLRGGRAAGRSSTAVPMRYARSEDELWRIGVGDGEPLDADGVVSALGRLREAVEAGRHASTEPVTLHVPLRHFAERSSRVLVSILDLPGSHAAAPHERELVRRVAERHLPNAGLILLVSRVDNLGVFAPDRLGRELEQLRDWMLYPERYRLITTRSYTSASVQDRWQDERISTLEEVQAMILQQFARFEDVQRQEGGQVRFYPLEHGRSWEALRADAPPYFAWADSVQRQALQTLREDIDGSADDARRLDLGRMAAREIRRRHRRLEDGFRTAKVSWRRQQDRLRGEVEQASAASRRLGERSERLRLETLGLSLPEDVAAKVDAHFAGLVLREDAPPRRDAIREWLEEAADQIDERLSSWRPACRPPSREPFDALFDRLDGYWFDYWPKLADGSARDLAEGRQAIAAYLRAATDMAEAARRLHLSEVEARIAEQRRSIERRRRIVLAHLFRLRKQLEVGCAAWAESRRAHLRAIAVARRDRVRADRFDERMRQGYLAEARRIAVEVRKVARAEQPGLALARLCQLRLTADVYRNRCTSRT